MAVGEFHRDSDFGHDTHEVNFWLPFTDAYETNTVWIEDPITKKIEAMEVKYGNVTFTRDDKAYSWNIIIFFGIIKIFKKDIL